MQFISQALSEHGIEKSQKVRAFTFFGCWSISYLLVLLAASDWNHVNFLGASPRGLSKVFVGLWYFEDICQTCCYFVRFLDKMKFLSHAMIRTGGMRSPVQAYCNSINDYPCIFSCSFSHRRSFPLCLSLWMILYAHLNLCGGVEREDLNVRARAPPPFYLFSFSVWKNLCFPFSFRTAYDYDMGSILNSKPGSAHGCSSSLCTAAHSHYLGTVAAYDLPSEGGVPFREDPVCLSRGNPHVHPCRIFWSVLYCWAPIKNLFF